MADYHRWISYLYSYESGSKGECVGHARLERRGGRMRVTLFMNKVPDKEWRLCFADMSPEQPKGVLIGAFGENGEKEARFETESDNLAGSGRGIQDMNGLALFDEDGNCLASVWDENELDFITIERLFRQIFAQQDMEEDVAVQEDKVEEAILQEDKVEDATMQEDTEEKAAVQKDKVGEAAMQQNRKEETAVQENNREEAWEKKVETPRTETMLPIQSISAEIPSENLEEKEQNTHREMKIESIQEEEKRVCDMSREDRVFACLPPMNPFENHEFEKGVRMEPQDIGMLPRAFWGLAGNSFLLHSFYSYNHLLFIRKRDRQGSRCYLMLPGTYERREQHMAQMFGFSGFRPAKCKPLESGCFGYWYMEVKFASSDNRE